MSVQSTRATAHQSATSGTTWVLRTVVGVTATIVAGIATILVASSRTEFQPTRSLVSR
jgi:3-hydroxyisobutyrate dehydrogenase-like beta-hydroxyacid dehydrogenase